MSRPMGIATSMLRRNADKKGARGGSAARRPRLPTRLLPLFWSLASLACFVGIWDLTKIRSNCYHKPESYEATDLYALME